MMKKNLNLPSGSAAISPDFLIWKYWISHPWSENARGYILHDSGRIVSHGGRWPIRLQTSSGDVDACHLIDWVADRAVPGAGMKVVQACSRGLAAMFSVGGSEAAQKVVSAFGFKPANPVWQMSRPLRPWAWARGNSPKDWKLPARWVRTSWQSLFPKESLAAGWTYAPTLLSDIPETLFPGCTSEQAVSARDARLLAHLAACPRFKLVRSYLLRESSQPIAYFVLAQVGGEVRLIDFGPASLAADAAYSLGISAQQAARADFPDAAVIATLTTEPMVREGFLHSGFRENRQKVIRVLSLTPAIRGIGSFRLTMIDWDAACL